MIKQGEVFVITDDDILQPSGQGAGRTGGAPTGSGSKGAPRGERTASSRTSAAMAPTLMGHSAPRRRNPAAASTLSLLVWGLGQFYNGDRRLGMLFLLCELQVLAVHYMLYRIWSEVRRAAEMFFVSESELLLYVAAADFCLIFFMAFNVAQAYRGAETHGGRFEGLHRPFVAGIASTLIPGWGQLLNAQLGKATIFLSAFLLQLYLIGLYLYSPFYRIVLDLDPEQILLRNAITAGTGVLFGTALCWLISAYDAFLVARYTRRLSG